MTGERTTELDGDWTLSFTHPLTGDRHRMPATVPGNVEIDLAREGLIGDPYPPDRLDALRDFERVDDWTYETTFDAPAVGPGETATLVFEGIDTIADVALNGEKILRCENMFIPHSADVTGKLRAAGNRLSVRIFSPELHARRFSYDAFQVSRGRQSQAYLRKARHAWGWDNAPRLLSAGIWRPARIVVAPPIRFSDVYAYTQLVRDDVVWIGVNWAIETPDADLSAYRGSMTLSYQGEVEHARDFDVDFTAGRLTCGLPAESVRLWWPRGYGDPHLYDLALILRKGGEVVAEWSARFGIRDLELSRTETTNAKGEGEFVFVCNGEKIYINGTNWKPLDALHSRAAGKVRRALDLCLDLHCNMVRIWGGGVYEDHDFFDYCDQHGLLVWQDFMFACEFPPRDAFFQQAVAREAEVIVKRLRNHASLAVWCGDNEVDMAFAWGTLIPRHLLPSHNEISRKVLKNAVLSHDPYRSYVESSPYVSDAIARERWRPLDARADLATPEDHLYPADENFRAAFRASAAHFVGETGPFLMNAVSDTPAIVEREMARARRLWPVPIAEKDYTLDRHQLDAYFLSWKDAAQKRLRHFFGREFGLAPWSDFALGVNIVCADIFKHAIEYSRSRKWRKTGVIWWSLLDMWPMLFNYSVVDYEFRPKMPYYWIRRSQQPVCLMAVEPHEDADPEIYAANDTRKPWRGRYRILSVGAGGDGEELLADEFAVPANASARLRSVPRSAAPALWIVQWRAGGQASANHYVCGKPPFDFDTFRDWCARLDGLLSAAW